MYFNWSIQRTGDIQLINLLKVNERKFFLFLFWVFKEFIHNESLYINVYERYTLICLSLLVAIYLVCPNKVRLG